MSGLYKLYRISDNISENPKEGLQARTVSRGTYDIEKISERLADSTTLTATDIYAVITGLSQLTATLLEEGYNVNLEGIGTLSVTAESPLVQSEKEIQRGYVKFKRIVFRPALKLTRKLKNMKFEPK